MALESLFDHIEVEGDEAEEFHSVPADPSPPTVQPEQHHSSHGQPPQGSAAVPKTTAPSRYVRTCLSFVVRMNFIFLVLWIL